MDISLTLNMTSGVDFSPSIKAQNDKVRAFVFESELMPKGTALCHTEPLAKYPNDKTKMLKCDKKGRK